MDFSQIKQGDTILAPSYLHTYIRNELLKNRNGLTDVTILTFDTFFKDETKEYPTIFDYYKKAKEMKNLQFHNTNTSKYAFIDELQAFIKKKHQFSLSYEDLNTNNAFMKEMKDILEYIDVFYTKEDAILDKTNALEDCHNIYILDEFTSTFKETIYMKLMDKGAHRLHFDTKLESKEYYQSLNKRKEVESIAQYIITHDINASDVNIQVCDSSYNKYIDSIFYEYNIPYSILNDKQVPVVCVKYYTLLLYYLYPTLENGMALYQRNVFTHRYNSYMLDYLDLHKCTLVDFYEKEVIKTKHLDDREYKQLKELQDNAFLCKKETYDTIEDFLSLDPKDVLLYVDTFLLENHNFHNNEERKGLLEIRKLYTEFADTSKQDLEFILSSILKEIRRTNDITGCNVSNISHPLQNNKYLFIVGASADNFPSFGNESGIFDEYTFENMKGYPTQEYRYDHHIKQVFRNIETCEHLIVSYSTSTFDGKAKEESLDMRSYMGLVDKEKARDFTFLEGYEQSFTIHALNQETAFELFTKDKKIHGSVSSIEQYGACPYKYFIARGLYLREPVEYGISVAKVGSLMHYIMETIAKDDKENFQDTPMTRIKEIIHEYLEGLKENYPAYSLTLDELEKRVIHVFELNMRIIKDMEANNKLVVEKQEEPFAHTYNIHDVLSIELHGIIDRIDVNNDFFRIVDYKSSEKNLSIDKVLRGEQLQLLTYATVMEEQLHKRLVGAFYYSFKNENIKAYAKKVSRNKIIIPEENEFYEEFKKNKRMTGWAMNEYISDLCDPDGTLIKNSNKIIYNPVVLKEIINEIYEIFAAKLLSGDISVDPNDTACTYCAYKSICKHTGGGRKDKDPWIDIPENLYIKGGKK